MAPRPPHRGGTGEIGRTSAPEESTRLRRALTAGLVPPEQEETTIGSAFDEDWSDLNWTRAALEPTATPLVPTTTIGGTLPPVVVPAHPGADGVELGDGTAAVVAFSTVGGLVERLGPDQPWAMVPASTARAAARRAVAVVLDPAPGVCAPRWSAPRIDALAGEVRRGRVV